MISTGNNYQISKDEMVLALIHGLVKTQNSFSTELPKLLRVSIFHEAKNFEIDWLLFLGGSLNIIEVGRQNLSPVRLKKMTRTITTRCNSEKIWKGTARCIKEKFQQIIKDHIIVKCLLTATNCENLEVNFLSSF